MLQISKTAQRDLDAICDKHYDDLKSYVLSKTSILTIRQREFIVRNLRQILVSAPSSLVKINQDYIDFCLAPGKARISKPNNRLSKVFNYSWFSQTEASHYCSYDLAARLNFSTCPYCNRNYTVTVIIGKKRIVRPDFDHFFPKSHYPLLSLSFYNLIPSCSICNRTIKNQQKIIYGKYVHPYEEGFGSALKFGYLPNDTDSAVGLKNNFTIFPITDPLQPEKSKKCLKSFELFKLREIYEESHSSELSEMLRKHAVSNGKYLEILKAAFPAIGSIEELYRLAFGNFYNEEDLEKRPLSKMTRDITDQLSFSTPISYQINLKFDT